MTDKRDAYRRAVDAEKRLRAQVRRQAVVLAEFQALEVERRLDGRVPVAVFERFVGTENVVDDDGRIDGVRFERKLLELVAALGAGSVGGAF